MCRYFHVVDVLMLSGGFYPLVILFLKKLRETVCMNYVNKNHIHVHKNNHLLLPKHSLLFHNL